MVQAAPKLAKTWMQHRGVKGKEQWEAEKLIELTRKLQPGIIINNRAEIDQDIWTPEQFQPLEWVKHPKTGELVTWEACQTFSGSWGYYRDEHTWKSPKMLIDMLINTVSIGGNLIMNVGPTARGCFDERANSALDEYAKWMKYNSRSIYGCTMAEPEFVAPRGTRFTQSEDGKRLYIHLVEYPFAYLEVPGLAGKVEYAQFLHDASELIYDDYDKDAEGGGYMYQAKAGVVSFHLPVLKPDIITPVIEVFLK